MPKVFWATPLPGKAPVVLVPETGLATHRLSSFWNSSRVSVADSAPGIRKAALDLVDAIGPATAVLDALGFLTAAAARMERAAAVPALEEATVADRVEARADGESKKAKDDRCGSEEYS